METEDLRRAYTEISEEYDRLYHEYVPDSLVAEAERTRRSAAALDSGERWDATLAIEMAVQQFKNDPQYRRLSKERDRLSRLLFQAERRKNPGDRSAMTAIARNSPPLPLKWLYLNGLLKGKTLDYGCGRQIWYGMKGYDPYWHPNLPPGFFDTITCIYVLNVVPVEIQNQIINHIYELLSKKGVAYFAVRRDLPRDGKMGRVYQRYVELNMLSVKETPKYEIYVTKKPNK